METLSKRVEVTLRASNAANDEKSRIDSLSSLQIGSILSGRIRRVELYGLFVTIDQTNLVRSFSMLD